MSERIRRRLVHYDPKYISSKQKTEILNWLSTLHPIWERRFSTRKPPPSGEEQRWLLRPVYWLGNWQFACLDYFHPPQGTQNRCVQAEPFPKVLQPIVADIEQIARSMYQGTEIPQKWHLNTCLINFYGSKIQPDGKHVDVARVGEHKDFEPGPVASVSFGERALFQFVSSHARGTRDQVILQQWLDDSSLQIFGGPKFKRELFHRVQRVDHKLGAKFKLNLTDFETRRINFTFRYVPTEFFVDYKNLPSDLALDVEEYMQELAKNSDFFKKELESRA